MVITEKWMNWDRGIWIRDQEFNKAQGKFTTQLVKNSEINWEGGLEK